MDYDLTDCDVEELKAEARAQRALLYRLIRHPDCRDPDHPGCERCEEPEEQNDE